MSTGELISYIMLALAIIGGIDRALGCKFGPGKAFEKGFETMGALVLAMVGLMAITPLISQYLAPVLTPFFTAIGIDPAVIGGIFLANDAGGWPLAMALAQDPLLGKFFGSAVASIMGSTIAGIFPMCFMLMPKQKHPLVAKGLIIGFVTVPAGCFVAGLCLGVPLGTLIINLLPQFLFSALFILGLTFFDTLTVTIVTIFGRIMTAFVTLALLSCIVVKVLDVNTSLLMPFDQCIAVIGSIAIFLSGAFTLLYFLEILLRKPLSLLSEKLGLDQQSILGLLTCTVNAIPCFSMTKTMSDRGIIVNIAFMVPAAFALGDHLAFQAAVDPSTVVPTVLGKMAGGALAILLALLLTKPRRNAT